MTEDIAWAAGLFEGEGSVTINRARGDQCRIIAIMSLTDYDVIERFHQIVKVGNMTGPRPAQYSDKQVWHWAVSKGDDVVALLAQFFPWLGERPDAKLYSRPYRNDWPGKPNTANTVASSS